MRELSDNYLYSPDATDDLRFLVEDQNGEVKIVTAEELVTIVWDRYWWDEANYLPKSIYWWDPSYQGPRQCNLVIEPPVVRIVIRMHSACSLYRAEEDDWVIHEDPNGLHDMDLVATGDYHEPWQVVRRH